ncbi:MAG: hypothetical protein M9934_09775 [Thermomicrobiales bacterium]|nr:hypothetical protein [Thermomicrobiales bacterium]MCO5228559.1 hypothetical protein [Thermomicrobiales bacterium]
MNPTENPTPTVQVEEIGLEQQASIGKVIAIAGVVAAVGAGLLSALRQRKPAPPTPPAPVESSRDYLKTALAKAQEKDIAKRTRKAAAKASKQTTADLEQLGKKLGEQISSAQGGSRSLLEAIKASGPEIERLIEAEVLPKLKEFGEEARQMSEQGKLKSADLTQKAKTEFAATSERIADKAADVVERAESEVLPAVKTQAGEIAEQAKQTAEHFGEEAKESLNQFATVADEKRKVAAASAREGGRDSRSLLIWTAAAGALVYGVLLDEQQQQKVREASIELLREVQSLIQDFTRK